MYGDLDSHDAPCRFLAERSGVRVLSVDYRLGPEHRFPAGHDDADAAYRWVVAHAADLGADRARLAVGGDSAGANLAANVALTPPARACRWPTSCSSTPSRTRPTRAAARACSGRASTSRTRSWTSPTRRTSRPICATRGSPRSMPRSPPGLAPAYVATAGFDPLRDEGEAYARKLADAGVPVEPERFPDQIHGFLNAIGAGRTSRAAMGEIAAKLKAAPAPDAVGWSSQSLATGRGRSAGTSVVEPHSVVELVETSEVTGRCAWGDHKRQVGAYGDRQLSRPAPARPSRGSPRRTPPRRRSARRRAGRPRRSRACGALGAHRHLPRLEERRPAGPRGARRGEGELLGLAGYAEPRGLAGEPQRHRRAGATAVEATVNAWLQRSASSAAAGDLDDQRA